MLFFLRLLRNKTVRLGGMLIAEQMTHVLTEDSCECNRTLLFSKIFQNKEARSKGNKAQYW